MYLGQAMGICPGLMNFQTFDTSGTPYMAHLGNLILNKRIVLGDIILRQ